MLNRRHFSRALSALAVVGAPSVRAQADRIVLGQSAPITGPAAQLGIQFNRGAKLCFEQVNAQGGVARRDIELVHLDDGYEPDRCVDNTRKLLANDVFALFGYIGTRPAWPRCRWPRPGGCRSSGRSPVRWPCANRSTATRSTCGLRTTTKPH